MKTTIEYDMWDIAFIFAMAICVSSSPWFLLGVAYGIMTLFAEKRATHICSFSFGWTKGKGWWFKK
jgi:hypothetical protein